MLLCYYSILFLKTKFLEHTFLNPRLTQSILSTTNIIIETPPQPRQRPQLDHDTNTPNLAQLSPRARQSGISILREYCYYHYHYYHYYCHYYYYYHYHYLIIITIISLYNTV